MDARPSLCPCCGQPVIVSAWESALACLSPMQRRIAETVARRPGRTAAELTDIVYADDQDGGPIWALESVRAQIFWANKRLRSRGFVIATAKGARSGYRILTVAP